jgi:Glycosyl hydrolases family 2, sugar binding domain/Glycosyl hydrolases family 2, TIM barrel domain
VEALGCPRPQLVRRRWISLDGSWDFALDPDGRWQEPGQVRWGTRIRVPFSPETPASGIGFKGFCRACWYRLRAAAPITPDEIARGERLFLRFGAVDHQARVWAGGRWSGTHEGGYTPFALDVTDRVSDGQLEIVVQAQDDPLDLAKPRGKQDWMPEPHAIWYPRTTGIWQTVWMEVVPATCVRSLRWTPSLERWEISLDLALDGPLPQDAVARVQLSEGGRPLACDTYQLFGREVSRRIAFPDPGIDDSRNRLLWSPESPTLLDARIEICDAAGRPLDRVESYTALRSLGVDRERVLLNGRPYEARLVLDQGYWPESGLTAPDEAALRRDIELTRAMGFNGARKHQKIEDPRYLYWADRLGLLVWEEMPSAYRFTTQAIERVTREWMDVLARDYSHPCIAAWVPFNESWGVPNLPDKPAERDWVRSLYHLTKTLDPTRPVIGNDGWESVATDIIGIHDYDDAPQEIASRYASHENRPRLFRHARPGGRSLVLDGDARLDHPVVLSEFGGIAYSSDPDRTWGYRRCASPDELLSQYRQLLEVVRSRDMLAGFCYTQLTDTYQEANGLLFADRRPKIPIDEIARATRGRRKL